MQRARLTKSGIISGPGKSCIAGVIKHPREYDWMKRKSNSRKLPNALAGRNSKKGQVHRLLPRTKTSDGHGRMIAYRAETAMAALLVSSTVDLAAARLSARISFANGGHPARSREQATPGPHPQRIGPATVARLSNSSQRSMKLKWSITALTYVLCMKSESSGVKGPRGVSLSSPGKDFSNIHNRIGEAEKVTRKRDRQVSSNVGPSSMSIRSI